MAGEWLVLERGKEPGLSSGTAPYWCILHYYFYYHYYYYYSTTRPLFALSTLH
jgi:hypothetical protein